MKFQKSIYSTLIVASVAGVAFGYDYSDNVAAANNAPGGLSHNETPVFVNIGWDDNTSAAGVVWGRSIMEGKQNPDGSAVRASFYFNSSTLNYDNDLIGSINDLNVTSHEIGNHTCDHQKSIGYLFDPEEGPSSDIGWAGMVDYLRTATVSQWDKIVAAGEDSLIHYTNVTKNDIIGFRAPYLEYGTNLFGALKNRGYEYDCSIETNSTNNEWLWPHTLNSGSPSHDISWKNNDGNAGKFVVPATTGLWELPAYALVIPDDAACANYGITAGLRTRIRTKITWMKETDIHITGFDYNLWGNGGQAELDSTEFVGILKYNLDLRIENNRAPLLFGAHTQYYVGNWAETNAPNATSAQMQGAMEEFVDYAISKNVVRVVTTEKVMNWMRDPKALSTTAENEAPTGINLSNNSITVGGTTVGQLSTVDDGGEHEYTVVSGNFSIDAGTNVLKANAGLAVASYPVTIKTTDDGNLSFEKEFTITVTEAVTIPNPVEVFGDISWSIVKDAFGTGTDGSISNTTADIVEATLTHGANEGTGDATKYAYVSLSGYLESPMKGVTHIAVEYSSDKALALGVGGDDYGFTTELASGSNQTDTIDVSTMTRSWGTADLLIDTLQSLGFESKGEGETNLSVTKVTLFGYEPVVIQPSDTLELMTSANASWDKWSDVANGATVVLDSAADAFTGKGTFENPADAEYAGMGTVWIKKTDFNFEGVKRIEVKYTANADFVLNLPMKGVTDLNGSAHRIELPATESIINVGVLDSRQHSYPVEVGPTLIDLLKVEGLEIALADIVTSGEITIESLRLIYKGDEGQAVAASTPISSAVNANPMISSITSSRMNLSVPTAGVYNVKFFSVSGRLLKDMNSDLTSGFNNVAFDGSTLSSSMVIVQITGNGVQAISKAMVK